MDENPIERPVFLVSCVRSGSTLLGLMLGHHPEIAFPGEFEISVHMIDDEGNLPDLSAYYEFLRVHRHFLWHDLRVDSSLDYHALVRSFLAQMKRERDGAVKTWVGAAVHWRFEHLPSLWPEARFVRLVRDPRGVSASIIREGWSGNHYEAAGPWVDAERSWDRLRSRLAPDRWMEIRYEDLVRDPESVLSSVCAFVGVQFDQKMLDYPRDTTYEAVDGNVAFQWRDELSRRAIQLCEARVGRLLESRGYQRSGYPRLRIGPTQRRALEFHSRAAALRFRLRRYGLRLWLERKISSLLGITAWHDRARLREHAIKNRHLR